MRREGIANQMLYDALKLKRQGHWSWFSFSRQIYRHGAGDLLRPQLRAEIQPQLSCGGNLSVIANLNWQRRDR